MIQADTPEALGQTLRVWLRENSPDADSESLASALVREFAQETSNDDEVLGALAGRFAIASDDLKLFDFAIDCAQAIGTAALVPHAKEEAAGVATVIAVVKLLRNLATKSVRLEKRTLRVLQLVRSSSSGLSAQDIAKGLSIPDSDAASELARLEAFPARGGRVAKLVHRDTDGRWRAEC